ncbi:aldose 1-epimerase [Leishmania donovani]|uniref:Aldose_1-epimerase_-_putative n=2 Tax=Leishmania donovani species complex TaxID=38574 RepID=A0A6L0XQ08_LEIIN|nr:aldose 1-epimerase, putative [Leishmania donovani]CAC9543407.1 aldose_1-epimerase_-_putative [Leishmania infantum]TPP44375.1 Aldose 1-epimerase family protein [Leishmania donovani]CAJ1992907.1 aldose 1-epimerase [Leishmania donovani]SUZ45925.1 aldose_1-epimerase_-_putative [Leishmania infantum]
MTFQVEVRPFGAGKLIWLKTARLRVGLANFGATISSVQVFHPQRQKWIEVNCAFPESAAETEADTDYMGVTAGRCGGRVAHATFKLDGVTYHTDKNMAGRHTCHGGHNAFNKKHWGFAVLETATEIGVTFNYTSPHMENGFPAELVSKVTYSIERTKPNVLKTHYDSYIPETSPADATPVNIFNHAYWNLNGIPERNGKCNAVWEQPESVRNHWLRVPASRVAEADRMAIPTGEFLSVEGTGLDFRQGRVIGDCIDDVALLDRDPCGYDHPLAIDGWEKGKLMLHAEAKSPVTNICMKVYSTFPCMWVYTANNKPLPASGGPGQRYARWTGMGLEPQYFPDGANHYPKYPSCIIRRGKSRFTETMLNEFTVDCSSKM